MYWPYHLRLKDNPLGLFSKTGIIIKSKSYGDISPLPFFSCEKLLKRDAPHVKFALFSANLSGFHVNDVEIAPLIFRENDLQEATTYKIKVSHLSIEDAISKIKRLKKLYPKKNLRIDANRSWSLDEAHQFTRHFSPNDFAYLEEPVKEMSTFAFETDFPLAVDESIFTLPLDEIFTFPTLKALVIKPTLFGGLEEIETLKTKSPVPIVLSSAFESGVGILSIAKIASHLNLSEPIGIDTYRFLKEDVLKTPLSFENGRITKACLTSSLKVKENIPIIDASYFLEKATLIKSWQSKSELYKNGSTF